MLGIFLPKGQGNGLGEAGLVAQVQERGGVACGVRPKERITAWSVAVSMSRPKR